MKVKRRLKQVVVIQKYKKTFSSEADKDSCCSEAKVNDTDGFIRKVWDGVAYAFTDLLDNIMFWLVVGLVFAAFSSDICIK